MKTFYISIWHKITIVPAGRGYNDDYKIDFYENDSYLFSEYGNADYIDYAYGVNINK